LINWELGNKLLCSDTEKDECLQFLDKLISFTTKSRKCGLLSLEEEIEKSEDFLLKKGLQLVTSGMPAEYIRELFENYIATSNLAGKELLKRILILEGILGIQRGEDTEILIERLASYFGETYFAQIESHFNLYNNNIISEYFEEVKSLPPKSSETALLEESFKNIDNITVQRILRETSMDELVSALSGASGEIQKSILSNVSKRNFELITDKLINYPIKDIQKIIQAQQKLLTIANKI
jgi:hypothetical protein